MEKNFKEAMPRVIQLEGRLNKASRILFKSCETDSNPQVVRFHRGSAVRFHASRTPTYRQVLLIK